MRLSLHTDYALRTLMYLASEQERSQIQEIADFFGVSRDHLAKVVRRLSKEGYVRTVRGVGGGMELALEPEKINLGEFIDRFEGPLHLLECVAIDNVCKIQPCCQLKSVFSEAERIQREFLGRYHLSDFISPETKLTELISDVTD